MSPVTTIFARDKSPRLFEKSHGFFQTGVGSCRSYEDFFSRQKNRTKYDYNYQGETLHVTASDLANSVSHVTAYTYDLLGRQTNVTGPVPDGTHLSASTETEYDVRGNVYSVSQALDSGFATTYYVYDAYNRLKTQTDPNGSETSYTYYDTGMRHTLTDPDSNTTTWAYDALNRVQTETNQLGNARTYTYSGGLLSRVEDRLHRVDDYGYDRFGRQTDEYWYQTVADANNQTNVQEHLSYTYNRLGSLLTGTDATGAFTSSYTYTPDALGRATGISQTVTGLPTVSYVQTFNGNGNRTELAATIDGTADFVNSYEFDNLGRMNWVKQHSATGQSNVAAKRVDFTYHADGQFDTISRYADTNAAQHVATSTFGYDNAGRLTGLSYAFPAGSDTAPAYTWDWDRANRIIGFTSAKDAASGSFGSVVYTNDAAGQLTDAVYSNWLGTPGAEDYNYDANGNRINDGYTVPTTDGNNQMATGAGFHYSYDDEGNRAQRYKLDGNNNKIDITDYAWDNRNRLTKITNRATDGGAATQVVEYTYDYANRWLGEKITVIGETTTITQKRFVYDGNQIVLQFEKTGTDAMAASDLTHRDLWGAAVDQFMAQENVSSLSTAGEVFWGLTDNLNSVRDLATYNANTDTTTIAEHRSYDSFGVRLNPAAVDCIFGYTARPFDEATKIQNNLNRWYEAITHKWLSEDPIGFAAGDTNLNRYCASNPISRRDPSGWISFSDASLVVDAYIKLKATSNYGNDWDQARASEGDCLVHMMKSMESTKVVQAVGDLGEMTFFMGVDAIPAGKWFKMSANSLKEVIAVIDDKKPAQDAIVDTIKDVLGKNITIPEGIPTNGEVNKDLNKLKDAFLKAAAEKLKDQIGDYVGDIQIINRKYPYRMWGGLGGAGGTGETVTASFLVSEQKDGTYKISVNGTYTCDPNQIAGEAARKTATNKTGKCCCGTKATFFLYERFSWKKRFPWENGDEGSATTLQSKYSSDIHK